MRILVTGAAGYIGARMVDALCNANWVETVVGTDIRKPQKPVSGCTFHQCDIRYDMTDIFNAHKIDTVVHTAYILPPIHNTALMEDINKGGTQNILNICAKTGVKQILYTSSTTAYGFYTDNDRPLTEESPLRGNNDFTYAKNKKEIEAILADFSRRHPQVNLSIVRPCFVVGPGFKNPMAEHLQKKFVPLPQNTLPWQYVHEDDVINVMLLLLQKRISGAYNVTADGTMTFGEMVRALGNIKIPLPWWLIYPLNNLAWLLRLTFISKFPSPTMQMMVCPWIASSDKLIKETGYRFKYNTRQAFADFVGSVKV